MCNPTKIICETYGITEAELNAVLERVDGRPGRGEPSPRDVEISDAFDKAIEDEYEAMPQALKDAPPAAFIAAIMAPDLEEAGIDPDYFKAQLKGEV